MAYRRRHGLSRSSTFKEGTRGPSDQDDATTSSAALHHANSDSRLDSFRSSGALHSSFKNRSKGSPTYDYSSMRSTNERGGFWGVLARKAKAILEDEVPQQSRAAPSTVKPETETVTYSTSIQKCTGVQIRNHSESLEESKKLVSSTLGMKLERLTPSLNQVGSTTGNTLEQNTKAVKSEEKHEGPRMQSAQPQRNPETQLQASRDVAIATAAKVKQLIRELKKQKAELALAKERCSSLEDENKSLVGAHKRGDHPADDDMIRVQLETLLEEKGRLAHENSVYALENRYLREIVEFHQLRMQDLMYLDEDIIDVELPITPPEDITEVTLPTTFPEADQNNVEGVIDVTMSTTSPEAYENKLEGNFEVTLPTIPLEADQNKLEGVIEVKPPTTPPESIVAVTLPTTQPKVDQNKGEGSSSSSSRYPVDEE